MKYVILTVVMLMLVQAAPLQTVPGQEDRAYWVSVLTRIAHPVLDNMSRGKLKKNMPVETLSGATPPTNARTTHLEALGRLLAGMAPWLELGPDESEEGQLREKYIRLMLSSIRHGFNPRSPDYLNFNNSFVIHPMVLDVLEVMQKHQKGKADFYDKERQRFSRYAEQQERMVSPINRK